MSGIYDTSLPTRTRRLGRRKVATSFPERREVSAVSEIRPRRGSRATVRAELTWFATPAGEITQSWAARGDAGTGNWLDEVHREDRDWVIRDWKRAIATGNAIDVEFRLLGQDGTTRWAHLSGSPLKNERGQVMQWVGTLTDIDEARRLEQALREREELFAIAVDSTGLGVWDMELPSHTTFWSPRLLAMGGWPPIPSSPTTSSIGWCIRTTGSASRTPSASP